MAHEPIRPFRPARPRASHAPRLALAALLALACAGALLQGCASGVKLARRSDEELRAGDPQRAWLDARMALQKDGGNPRVRASARAAAAALSDDWQQRLRAIAAGGDTLAAAEAARNFAEFRADAGRFGIVTTVDPAFEREWSAWRHTAAARHYAQGIAAEHEGDAKRAWLELHESDGYVADYRDLARRLPRVWAQAENRVVVVPFASGLGGATMAREAAETLHAYLEAHLDPDQFTFTRLLPMTAVWSRVTVEELGEMTREDALHLARQIGATRVVWGRLGAPEVETHVDHWREPLWRPVESQDDSGRRVVEWRPEPFEAVRRERRVQLDVGVEILDVDAPDPLARATDTRTAEARSVWARGPWPGDADAYRLRAPDRGRDGGDRDRDGGNHDADEHERAWHDTFGDWSVRALLEQARSGDMHPDDALWQRASVEHPLFTQRLPETPVLVHIALAPEWDAVRDQLLALDRR